MAEENIILRMFQIADADGSGTGTRNPDSFVNASISGQVITFTQQDGSTIEITLPGGSGGTTPRTHTIYAFWSTSTTTPVAASWTGAALASSATDEITLGTTAVNAYLYIAIPTDVNSGALTTVRQADGSLNQRGAFSDGNPATLMLGTTPTAHTIYRSNQIQFAASSGRSYIIN